MTLSNTQKEEILARFLKQFTEEWEIEKGVYEDLWNEDLLPYEVANWWLAELSRILEEKKEAVEELEFVGDDSERCMYQFDGWVAAKSKVLQILSNEEK